MAVRGVFAMIFFASATCASAHSEFELQGQLAPACSHEQSKDEPQPVNHCVDCMQVQYLQESDGALDSTSLVVVAASLPLPSQSFAAFASSLALPADAPELPPSLHRVLRI